MSTDVFCPLPWVLQATRNDGVFRVCAHAQNSPCRGEAKNAEGAVLTADKEAWSEARNADSLKKIRTDFLENKWPAACERCRLENQSGISSRQAEEVKRYRGVFEKSQARAVTTTDGAVENFGPLELDLRFGSRCNLKCAMCSPKSSDLWYQDHYHVWGASFKNWREEKVELSMGKTRVEASSSFDHWYMTPHFLEQVRLQLPHVRKVHFSGGEPLLVARFYEILEAIVEVGAPQETTVEFITNGTLLPDKLLALFPQFKKVNVGVSIDAVGEKNEYIRYPTKWKSILEVLEKLDETSLNVDPWIAITMMVYNICDLPEFISWRDEMKFKKINNNFTRPILMDHPLHNPAHLSMQILPAAVKNTIAKKLLGFLDGKKSFASPFLSENFSLAQANLKAIIEGQVRFMLADDKSHLLPKFISYTDKLDQLRKNSFWQTFPEITQLLLAYRDHEYSDKILHL